MYAVSEAEERRIRTSQAQLIPAAPLLAYIYKLSISWQSLQPLRLACRCTFAGHASRDTGRAWAELWYS